MSKSRPTKDEYILRVLSKITRKKWENYTINRIIHKLDDPDIEFVCQQYVPRPNGQPALIDLYFPQFNIALEIDEPAHDEEGRKESDKRRTNDIIAVTGCTEHRLTIKRTDSSNISLEDLHDWADKFVAILRTEKKRQGANFKPWDYESRYNPKVHIDEGSIDCTHGVAFAHHKDALRCFGYRKGHYQRAVWKIPNVSSWVWFPKFYENDNWSNSISLDGETITETYKGSDPKHFDRKDPVDTRIVFAHDRDALGQTLYRFLGEFAPDSKEGGARDRVYRRIETRIDLARFHHPN